MKPVINVWLAAEDFDSTLEKKYKSKFQTENLEYSFKELFIDNFSSFYDIKLKKILFDHVNKAERNLVVFPCFSQKSLIHFLYKVSKETYMFCVENNMKILFSYVRECPDMFPELDKHIENSIINKGYDLSYFKIVVNAFGKIEQSKYKEIFTHVNYFEKVMYAYILIDRWRRRLTEEEIKKPFNPFRFPGVKKEYDFLQKRKYKFSCLTGTLFERFERVLFLNKMYSLNLLNNSFFYSSIVLDKNSTKEFIESQACIRKISFSNDFYDFILKHKVFNEDGSELSPKQHIYNSMVEYQIPVQVSQSCVNVVLETMFDVPCITEKLFKPIIAGVPFIWFGSKNIKKFLEIKGYKMYPFIDYSFDSLDDSSKRLLKLTEEIERLNHINLKKEVNKCKDISIHNQKTFFNTASMFEDFLL